MEFLRDGAWGAGEDDLEGKLHLVNTSVKLLHLLSLQKPPTLAGGFLNPISSREEKALRRELSRHSRK